MAKGKFAELCKEEAVKQTCGYLVGDVAKLLSIFVQSLYIGEGVGFQRHQSLGARA